METRIIIANVQDGFELLDMLKKLRKLRESIYSGFTKEFTVKIVTDFIEV